jgi:hypothetical protein
MPHFVKSRGPVVLKRGPYETEDEANRTRDELRLDALYAGQEIYVEYQAFIEPERRTPRKPGRQKLHHRGRSGSRGGGRTTSDGSSKLRQKRRDKRRPTKRSGRRR